MLFCKSTIILWFLQENRLLFYLYETKQDVLLCEARPDSIKCFLFAEIIGLTYPMVGLFYPNSWRV